MTKADLVLDIDFLLQLENSTEYATADKLRNINTHYHKLQGMVVDFMDEWTFKGNWAYAPLVTDQEEYIFPSDILTIDRVELNYTGDDNDWTEATFKDITTISDPLSVATTAERNKHFTKTSPIYWKPDTRSIVLGYIPTENVVAGIRIWFTENLTDLVENTDEPTIVEPYHRILSLGAAYDFAIANEITSKSGIIKGELDKMIADCMRFYSKRSREEKVRIEPVVESYS